MTDNKQSLIGDTRIRVNVLLIVVKTDRINTTDHEKAPYHVVRCCPS